MNSSRLKIFLASFIIVFVFNACSEDSEPKSVQAEPEVVETQQAAAPLADQSAVETKHVEIGRASCRERV